MIDDRLFWLDKVGDLLERVYNTAEFTDADVDLIDKWREARGEAGMGAWDWWAKLPGDDLHSVCGASRDDVIACARREWPDEPEIRIVEARMWADWYAEVDQESNFAQTRNAETVSLRGSDHD